MACPRCNRVSREGKTKCEVCAFSFWKSNLWSRFKLRPEDYDRMLNAQGGVCAICGKTNPSGDRLAVDHDHKTGVIRGLLCTSCNGGLGLFKDDCYSLAKAIEYLRRHQ